MREEDFFAKKPFYWFFLRDGQRTGDEDLLMAGHFSSSRLLSYSIEDGVWIKLRVSNNTQLCKSIGCETWIIGRCVLSWPGDMFDRGLSISWRQLSGKIDLKVLKDGLWESNDQEGQPMDSMKLANPLNPVESKIDLIVVDQFLSTEMPDFWNPWSSIKST